MNKHTLTLAIAAGLVVAGSAANAQSVMLRMSDLIRYERMSPQEAASVIVIAQGLNVDTGLLLNTKRSMRTQAWNLAPVLHLSQRLRRHPLDIKELRDRGWTWDEIERNIAYGRYDDRRDRFDRRDQYGRADDWSLWQNRIEYSASVLEQLLGGRFGNTRGRDMGLHRNDRRRAQEMDRAYERRVWEQILTRTNGRQATAGLRWLDRGHPYGDIALAAYVARLVRVDITDVLNTLNRHRSNWNRVRDDYRISSDWERHNYRFDPRGQQHDPRNQRFDPRPQQHDPRRQDLGNPWHDWRGPWGNIPPGRR